MSKSDETNGGAPAEADSRGHGFWAHETAIVDAGAEIGDGTRVWHFSHVMGGARIGRRCVLGQNVFIASGVGLGDGVKVQNNVSVYDGVQLADDVFCGPSMVFTNVVNPRSHVSRRDEFRATRVRRGATLGANCTVICGNDVGAYALVGAGAVVTADVPDFALVTGVPGRVVGYVCACGLRLGLAPADGARDLTCGACDARYCWDGASLAQTSGAMEGGRSPESRPECP